MISNIGPKYHQRNYSSKCFSPNTPAFKHQSVSNVSSGKIKNYALALLFSAIGITSNPTNAKSSPIVEESIEHINEKVISNEVGWVDNIRVFASSGQRILSRISPGQDYSTALIRKLLKPEISSLEEANDSLMKNGYSFGYKDSNTVHRSKFYPLKTPGAPLNIFNKNDKNKNRFVLVLSMDYNKDTKLFEKHSNLFSKKMSQIYNIPSENILNIPVEDKFDFEEGLDSIVNQINKLPDKQNAELAILYQGHGGASTTNQSFKKIEGAMDGRILENLTEKEAKIILNKKLNNIKSIFIISACQSGAWITQNFKKALKIFA